MSGSLDGRVAVITGSASGIGAAMAREFDRRGARLVLVDVVPTPPSDRDGGDRVVSIEADLSSADAPARIVDAATSAFGGLDILCNNAGIMDGMRALCDTPDDVWARVLAVNLTGPFTLTRAALPVMLSNGGGSIINTASVASLFGARGGAAYTASKHGLVGLTKSIAAHYGDRGVRCNAICPGAVVSSMGDDWPPGLGTDLIETVRPSIPRNGDPEEIATIAVFLASKDASFVNGAVIVADAGWSAR